MTKNPVENITIMLINQQEGMPYDLLLDADPSRALIDEYLRTSMVYVALLADKIIGVYVLYPIDTDVIELKNLAVKDEFQRLGVGTVMLGDATKRAKEKHFKTMIIGTGNASFGPFYLYQKQGFEITHIRKNFITDNYPGVMYENGIELKHVIMLAKQL